MNRTHPARNLRVWHASVWCSLATRPELRLVVLTCIALAASITLSSRLGRTQTTPEIGPETTKSSAEKTITVHAAGRGRPSINLQDGTEIVAGQQAGEKQGSGSPASLLASADFDSDGTADLVTADDNGTLKFYRGNVDSLFPNHPAAKQRRAEGTSIDSPFHPSEKSFFLNIAADFLEAGDFNADGKKDVVALARGDKRLQLLTGDGHGNFSEPASISIAGSVTSFAAGEIGKSDGQTDVAVAVQNKQNFQLLVFEHPESAFKHKPEVFNLPGQATEIAIGNLDDDFYADIAVACGNELIIIHGRGQAYPWDLIPALGIKRPQAVVARRTMPFSISALAVGRFGNKRGETLAILSGDGNLYRLEPNRLERPSNNKLPASAKAQAVKNLFLPTAAEARNLAIIAEAPLNREEAEKQGVLFVDTAEITGGRLAEFLQKKSDEAAEKYEKADKKEIERMVAAGMPKAIEQKQRAKAAYLRSISGRPSTLASWSLETLVAGAQFTNAAAANNSQRMLRVNVSDSNLDDILLIDSIGNQIQLVSQDEVPAKSKEQSAKSKAQSLQSTSQTAGVTVLEVEGNPLAVLPLRLNLDALSDLVVLRKGALVPSVVMTAASQTFVVTSTDDTGDCQPGNPCSLRNAILLSNSLSGVDTINFGFSGVGIITPASELPVITSPVNILGNIGGNGQPLTEISGVNVPAPADGLKVRTSDTIIAGIAVSGFKSIFDGNGSQHGGNGITLESLAGSPRNGNNVLLANFLGTDLSGSLDKGNDATGLNVFDSDNNQIGGPGQIDRNVISGNDGAGISQTAGNDNKFWGNIIGLNSLGTGKLANLQGVLLTGANNAFGGDGAGMGNTVSGNGRQIPELPQCGGVGISIAVLVDLDTFELLTLNNTLSGNRFGTNPAGTVGLGNCSQGINTQPLTQTTIGSITQNGRNIVSDNGFNAIYCDDFSSIEQITEGGYCSISGNNIGTDVTGTIAIANDTRNQIGGLQRQTSTVEIFNNLSYSNFGAPGGTTPGGACTGFCNLFSGNTDANWGSGLLTRARFGSVGIFNNYIGTNQNGTQALPNTQGIFVGNSHGETYVGGVGFDENNNPISLGNLASGNLGPAVSEGGFQGEGHYATTYIEGNLIGTDVSGNSAIPNNSSSIFFKQAVSLEGGWSDQVFVGGTHPMARNIISGNAGNGVYARGFYGLKKIVNNLIGLNSSLNPLGNGYHGIVVNGYNTHIGGSAQEANQIYYNGTSGNNYAGVLVSQDASGTPIRGNSIAHNSGLGIDLTSNFTFGNDGGDGVTANDCHDPDIGANDRQNFPMLTDAPVFNANGTVTVTGVLLSSPVSSFTVDFYSSTTADASGHGEGGTHLGSIDVETDGNGAVLLDFTSSGPVSQSSVISATATDRLSNTSEFSCNAGATCSGNSASVKKDEFGKLNVTCAVDPIVVNVNTDEVNDPVSQSQDTCDVFTDVDHPGPQCTLRAAIQVAEHHEGYDRIEFAIPESQVISPTGPFLNVTQQLLIDGTTQPGYAVGSPTIELNGTNAGVGVDGLHVAGQSIIIKGLIINRFSGSGIFIDGGGKNTVAGCFIGTTSTGNGGAGNKHDGIKISNSPDNLIGGKDIASRNVISANGDEELNTGNGVTISGASSRGNQIYSCYIGTNAAGTAALGNRNAGVYTTSHATYVGDTLDIVGRSLPPGNLISGNGAQGIAIIGESGFVRGNRIGTDYTGTASIPNQTGTYFQDSDGSDARHNLISGNNGDGVVISNSSEMKLDSNFIGTDEAGMQSLGNRNGVLVTNGSHDNYIGQIEGCASLALGRICGYGIISGNRQTGILIEKQAGAAPFHNYVVGLRIGLDKSANAAVPNQTGVSIRNSQGNIIYQNRISGNTTGISITGVNGGGNYVLSTWIGTNVGDQGSPEVAIPNTDGIVISSSGNHIGSGIGIETDLFQYQHANIIAGNTSNGIVLRKDGGDPAPSDNQLERNLIGLTVTRQITNEILPPILNGTGVLVTDGAHDNFIGTGTFGVGAAGFGNYIVGSVGAAISIIASPNGAPFHNIVDGNSIGLTSPTAESSVTLGNQVGIRIQDSELNVIRQNVISGSTNNGIEVAGGNGGNNEISRNHIGTTRTDDQGSSFGNGGIGISIASSNNIITKNTIGYSGLDGIVIQGDGVNSPPTGNLVLENLIGTNGTFALPNGGSGVLITNGASANFIGRLGEGNLISGNAGAGVSILRAPGGSPSGNNVVGNRIGTDRDGISSIPNAALAAIEIKNSDGNHIDQNLISGNLSGIYISGLLSSQNLVRGNCIGLKADCQTTLKNSFYGVFIADESHDNVIGGPAAGNGNKIAFNLKAVVLAPDAGCCNLTDPNSIFGNEFIGIDNGDDGETANDAGDADEGPNRLQNFPEFISAVLVPGGNLVIQYKVDSTPDNSNYGTEGLYIEFFEGDASPSLQGEVFLANTYYTEANYIAGMPGLATLVLPNASGLGIQVGDQLVATATDADGNTSEFTSVNVGVVTGTPTAATAIIEGQIVTADGSPLAGVVIALSGTQNRRTITDDNGRYRFTEVETTGFYSVAPSRSNFSFTPASRSFSALGNTTNAAFTAIADTTQTTNPLDTPEYFVRQHYLDFLGREPDESGFNFWSGQIRECGNDAGCTERRRINVSAAYFLSIEFQQTGGLVDGLYRASYGVRPQFAEFMPDTRTVARDVVVGRQGWQAKLEANKQAFVDAFVQRPAFHAAYDGLSNSDYVDALISHTGVSFTTVERDALVNGLANGTLTRSAVLRSIAENNRFVAAKFNEAFVMMQYFGYLRRDPDESGYQFWLRKLNEFNGNFEQAEMVRAFLISGEYRQRFGP